MYGNRGGGSTVLERRHDVQCFGANTPIGILEQDKVMRFMELFAKEVMTRSNRRQLSADAGQIRSQEVRAALAHKSLLDDFPGLFRLDAAGHGTGAGFGEDAFQVAHHHVFLVQVLVFDAQRPSHQCQVVVNS